MRALSLIAAAIVGIAHAAGAQEAQAAREYWLLAGSAAVVTTEPGFATRGRVDVGVNAGSFASDPHHDIVAIASTGAIKKKGLFGGLEDWPEPGSKSTVTLIRRGSLEVVARTEVAFRPQILGFSQDGRVLVVLSQGQVHKDPKRHLAPHVFALDAESGKVTQDSVLESEPRDHWFLPESGRALLALAGHEKRPDAPPELVVFDAATGALSRTKLPGSPLAFRRTGVETQRYLELENAVVVVDSSGRLMGEPIRAGDEKLFLLDAPEGGRALLAGKTKKAGKLVVLEAGAVTNSLDVPPLEDVLFDGKGGRIFLCASKQALVVAASDLASLRSLTLPDRFRDVHLNPAGDRLYVNEVGDSVSVVDVESGRQLAHFASGRGGKKLLLAAAAGLASALSPYRYGLTMRMPYQNVDVPTAVQSLAFSPSGRFVYVHNSTTADITVVETEGHTSVLKVGTGATAAGPFLWTLPGARQLLSVGASKLMAFDTDKGALHYEREFPKSWLSYLPELGLVQVRSKLGLELWRPWPLEKAASLGPPDAKVLVLQGGRRVFVYGEQATQVLDGELNRLGEVATGGDTLHVFVVESPSPGR